MGDLTGSTALDVAIGLAFTYLILSLFCSAIQEAIAGIFDLRASTLEKGLRELLQDSGQAGVGGAPKAAGPAPGEATNAADDNRDLADEVLGHAVVRGLYKKSTFLYKRKRRGPSYIPSKTFAIALLDVVAPQKQATDPLANVATSIDGSALPTGTKKALLTFVNGVARDRDHLRRLVEEWFDGSMARVSGWYKRKAQIIISAIALAVTIGLNVNTIAIVERLTADDAVRNTVVQQATKTTTQPTPKTLKESAKTVRGLQDLGVPLGWNKQDDDPVKAAADWRTIAGWALSWIALSLGAPFWFDVLSRLARIRNAGAPESPHETTPRRDDSSGGTTTTIATPAGGTVTTTSAGP